MKTKTITLYNFSELSEQAQNRAAHKYQDVIQDIYCADIYQALQDENDYVSDTEHIKEYFKECDFYDWYEDGTMYIERK